MNIIETLEEDYQRFPDNQTYSIYADDVYFKDPMNEFRGIKRYQKMIEFIKTFFLDPYMDVKDISQDKNTIRTEWILSWNTPLPWKPRISISGWSELHLNAEGLIDSHIDYWYCSRFDVVKQHLFFLNSR
ncbi:MAG: DUF2358 domain-containing protein [Mastigocoleus sp.]